MQHTLETQRRLRARRTRAHIKRSGRGIPRLSVFRSARSLSVQVIDDERGITVASAHARDLAAEGNLSRKDRALALGKLIAERAKRAGVTAVAFDRGPYAYHGLVRAVAEGARAGGLHL